MRHHHPGQLLDLQHQCIVICANVLCVLRVYVEYVDCRRYIINYVESLLKYYQHEKGYRKTIEIVTEIVRWQISDLALI